MRKLERVIDFAGEYDSCLTFELELLDGVVFRFKAHGPGISASSVDGNG